MADDPVRLDAGWAESNEFLRDSTDTYVAMSVAAAITFHQAHGNTRAIISRRDYDDALGIAAAALSRLIPIYTLRDPSEGRVRVVADLTRQRFARGASELHGTDGSSVGALSVVRSDLISAISLIRRTGLPFSFALSEPEQAVDTVPFSDLGQESADARGYRGIMQIPLQVSLHGISSSDALQNAIRDKAATLERYYAHIVSCRVVLELEGRHKRHGRQFSVRIDVKVPSGEIAVNRQEHEDLQVALRDAFDAARRKLEDYARVQRGDVKRHAGA
jgi:ribosomal subunit interface protein